MVIVAQLVRAPDCGSGGHEFDSHYPPQQRDRKRRFATTLSILSILGCSQVVRQRTLTPSCVCSNPTSPARKSLITMRF